jgi:hypothetical protein
LTLNLFGLSNLLSKTNSFEMTEISSPYFPPSSVRGWMCKFTELVDEGDLFFRGDDGVSKEDDAALGAAEWKYLSV